MIVIHHLGVSQSERVVWLMEELGLPYELKWYKRQANRLMPPEYETLHPAATAPVIQDGELTLAESGAIVEYICHKYAGGRLTVGPQQPNYAEYLYWMHWHNNVLGLYFARNALRAGAHGPDAERIDGMVTRRSTGYFRFLEQRLGASPYLGGPEFTCADIMCFFALSTAQLFGWRSLDNMPNAQKYVARIAQRPAYIKAMAIAGPKATPPA
jgi:glutathione S-transferase